MEIRTMTSQDWPAVSRIYAEGLSTGMATFETEVPEYTLWDRGHLQLCRFVALKGNEVCGWAALSPVSGRCVYGGVAEVSIYIGQKFRGQGVGEKLLHHLIQESEAAGFWTLQSGIFPENLPSIRLHEKAGFRLLGRREKVGRYKGVWKDNVVYERRSKVVGIN
jgi:phosphinothricin acetyltransferase